MNNEAAPVAIEDERTVPVPVQTMRDLVFGSDADVVDDRDELFPRWDEEG